ncbi:hypothetical protein [Rhizobium aethiopicum]|uniref:hypothetical protein n=1 Tax=Rhizobium aethiopicum TaxID=1138170 RepID=UPI001FD98F2D|nr:hypothetical protein [Rhizobium aethiopicum]
MHDDDRREGAIARRAGQISEQRRARRLGKNLSLFESLADSKSAELHGRAFKPHQFLGFGRDSGNSDAEKSDEAKKKSCSFHQRLHRLTDSLLFVRRS